MYIGDFNPGSVIRGAFNTRRSDGTPITLAGSPQLSVYKDASLTQRSEASALTVDFDGVTGHHLFSIPTSDAFYSTGSDFRVVITSGTVDDISVVGVQVASFSLANRYIGVGVNTDWTTPEKTAIRAILGFGSSGTIGIPAVGVMSAVKEQTDLNAAIKAKTDLIPDEISGTKNITVEDFSINVG